MSNLNERNGCANITIDGMEQDERVNENPATSQNVFNINNYLNVKLKPNESEKVLKIRLLPIDKNANSPFKRITMHSIKLKPEQRNANSTTEWKSFVCLEKTEDIDHDTFGCKCPFCEENRKAYNMFKNANNDVDKERWKKISLGYLPSEVGIIRCIERGHEEDGPKFWKFNIRQDGLDPMSSIKRCYKTAMEESIEEGDAPLNILDIYQGKDLKVTIKAVYDKEGKRTQKTSVTIEPFGKVKPISENNDEIISWVNDEKVWSDVFVAKPYDYLSIIIDGKVPFFDKTNKKWVSKDAANAEHTEEVRKANDEVNESYKKMISGATTNVTRQTNVNTATTVNDEDLPF